VWQPAWSGPAVTRCRARLAVLPHGPRDRRKPAPDRMQFARPRQPAAGRRPPLHPEHAETGRPLPRVTVTDDSVPEPFRPCRPTSAALAHLRRCNSGRRPTSTHDGSRLDPPPTAQCSARTLQGGADVCGDAGPATGSVREVRHRSFRYPGKGHLVPRVSDRSGPGHRRPAHRTQDGTLAVTGLRSGPLPARDAGRRRLARGTRAGGRSFRSATLPPMGGRLPEAPGRRPPRPRGPGADPGTRGRNAGPRTPGQEFPARPGGRNRQ
jgi:hypothetical protein